MKRALLENIKVAPLTSGATIDRLGFLSAIVGAEVTATGTLTLTVTHSDEESGTFEPVTDTRLEATGLNRATTGGVINVEVEEAGTVNVDLDLVGCKQFIQVAASGAAAAGAAFAIALGDAQTAPV
jgi:hypothetical protein